MKDKHIKIFYVVATSILSDAMVPLQKSIDRWIFDSGCKIHSISTEFGLISGSVCYILTVLYEEPD